MGRTRIPKTRERNLLDLDAHLFLLRTHLHELRNSASHLKVIAAELRTLVCRSSGTEGLLWRLASELSIDDGVALHRPGKFNPDHPLAFGLQFLVVPLRRAGQGDPRLEPDLVPFSEVIKEGEALIALGKPLTHEYLIKAVAQQMGSAHEDEGVEPALAQLSAIFLNGVEPFVEVLAFDAELVLEVGERVLEAAEVQHMFTRPHHHPDYGDVSISTRLHVKQTLAGRVPLWRMTSDVSAVEIACFAGPTDVTFQTKKRAASTAEISLPYPAAAVGGEDVGVVLSYCSRVRRLRAVGGAGSDRVIECDLGWLHAAELALTDGANDYRDLAATRFVMTHERLLAFSDVVAMLALGPQGEGLWISETDAAARGPFPP